MQRIEDLGKGNSVMATKLEVFFGSKGFVCDYVPSSTLDLPDD